jgi:hypothetical protein
VIRRRAKEVANMGHHEQVEFFDRHDWFLVIPAFLPAVAFGVLTYAAMRVDACLGAGFAEHRLHRCSQRVSGAAHRYVMGNC